MFVCISLWILNSESVMSRHLASLILHHLPVFPGLLVSTAIVVVLD